MSVRFFCLCQCSRNQQCLQSNLFFCKFLDCFSLLLRLPLHSASPKWRRLTKSRAYLNLNRILLSFSSPILNEPCLPVTEQTALKPKNYSRFCQFEVKKRDPILHRYQSFFPFLNDLRWVPPLSLFSYFRIFLNSSVVKYDNEIGKYS